MTAGMAPSRLMHRSPWPPPSGGSSMLDSSSQALLREEGSSMSEEPAEGRLRCRPFRTERLLAARPVNQSRPAVPAASRRQHQQRSHAREGGSRTVSATRSSHMTRNLMTLTAAAALALAAGCSTVKDNTPPPAGTVSSAPYGTYPSGSYETAPYGYVRDIKQLDTSRRTSGTGAILGAVIGGAVGNQIGHGTGRAAATAIGAVGG